MTCFLATCAATCSAATTPSWTSQTLTFGSFPGEAPAACARLAVVCTSQCFPHPGETCVQQPRQCARVCGDCHCHCTAVSVCTHVLIKPHEAARNMPCTTARTHHTHPVHSQRDLSPSICRRDEMAARDLPAMLSHELMTTGVADIYYIGHSQGTTIGMAFLSSGSALAQHIKVGACWAAAAVGHGCGLATSQPPGHGGTAGNSAQQLQRRVQHSLQDLMSPYVSDLHTRYEQGALQQSGPCCECSPTDAPMCDPTAVLAWSLPVFCCACRWRCCLPLSRL